VIAVRSVTEWYKMNCTIQSSVPIGEQLVIGNFQLRCWSIQLNLRGLEL